MNQAPDLAREASNKDPGTGLRAVVALRKLLEQLERVQVENARGQGCSWQAIAEALLRCERTP